MCLISGGFSDKKQERELLKEPEIIIATIGRFHDFLKRREFDILENLPMTSFLIFDEVDRILELGQFKEVETIIKFIENPNSLGVKYDPYAAAMVTLDAEGNPITPKGMDETFSQQVDRVLGQGGPSDAKVKKNSKRRTFIISATLGKSFWSSRVMNKKAKKKYRKLLKDNPEATPNMKL